MRTVTALARAVCFVLFFTYGAGKAGASPIDFSLDTSSLVGLGAFAFDAQLLDGDGVTNTSVTLDLFDFGGGGAVGAPTYVGGSSGSLSGNVVLNDSDFFKAFTQSFTPGTTLNFRLSLSTTALGVPQPEGFVLSILDSGGNPLATTDPTGFDSLIFGEIAATGSTFEAYAISTAAVPEPTSLVLLVTGLSALVARSRGTHSRRS